MDQARWGRIRALYEAVCDRPPAERDAALREACGDDTSLYDDVRALFELDAGEPLSVERVVGEAVSGLVDAPAEDARVGPYRIVREIGQGGMGAVYLADRVDGQFEQQVALKRIRPGLNTDQFLRRFQAERQILARLQHPHIARLLDGGVDSDGRPYFAMEYVAGAPIDRFCETHGLSVDERLKLFLDVCRAVTYAHGNLVIHRDLKPAHVLVTEDRHVRLLDFGIAKVLSDEEAGPGLTQVGIRALTPEYASPEQVRSEPVGTATDVYSLGVILYELLTGQRPYEITGRSPVEVERVVCGSEPEKPSTASGPRRRLSGDLDVICLKALQKDPVRRYASVEALSEDIRRHLAGLPVLARPDSVRYRLGKFVTRHRAGVAMTAGGLLVLAALTGYHVVRLSNERDRARLEAAKAEQVATFLRELFEVSDPSESKGQAVTARELLDAGAARIERDLAGQPDVRATMMRVIGDVYGALGLSAEARPLLERAAAEHRRLHGDEHAEVAESETALGVVLQNLGDVAGAEALYRRALETRLRLYGEPHAKVSESLADLAFLLETRGDAAGAVQMARQVLAMERALFPPDDPRVTKATAELAGMLRRTGRLEEAEPLLRAALAAQRRHYGSEDLTVASTARNLASLLRDRGALDEAEVLYREAIATRRKILGDVHPDVAVALNSHAMLLDRKGDLSGAAASYREAIRVSEQVHRGQPHPDMAAMYSNLAATLRGAGQLVEAAATYTLAIAMVDRVLAPAHPNRAFARLGLAGVYLDQKRYAAAEPLIRDALALRRAGLEPGHRYTGDALVELGACLSGLRRFAEAERVLLEAEQLFLKAAGPDDARTTRARQRLEALHQAWRKKGEPLTTAGASIEKGRPRLM
jgi:serine/threonine-protein kinase